MDAINEWPVLANAKELKVFLGTAGYHRRYIHNCSQLASPLYELVNQDPNKGKLIKPEESGIQPLQYHLYANKNTKKRLMH